MLECRPASLEKARALMTFEKRHDQSSSEVTRLQAEDRLAGMLDRWQRQCQLISTACGLRGGGCVIGEQWAHGSAANCWPLREHGKGSWEQGKEDTYELERLP